MEIIGKDRNDDSLIVKMGRNEVLLYKKMFGAVKTLFNNISGEVVQEAKPQKIKKVRKPRTPKNLPDLDKGEAGKGWSKKAMGDPMGTPISER